MPFRSEIRAYMANMYRQKRVANLDSGFTAFEGEKTAEFLGYQSTTSARIFNIAVIYDPRSSKEIVDRVANPLQTLANKHNVPVLVAGITPTPDHDLAPHTVIEAGVFNALADSQIEEIQRIIVSPGFKSLPSFPNPDTIRLGLVGREFTFRHLVLGPNSYIGAAFDTDQESVFKTRIAARALMTAALIKADLGFDTTDDKVQWLSNFTRRFAPPYSYYDIFHSSVLRVNGSASRDSLLNFAQEAHQTIAVDLARNPLTVVVGRVHIGSALDFQMALGPQQVDKNKIPPIIPKA